MSKTAVLIVSLTWKLGRRGPLDGKWAVQVQEQIHKQVQVVIQVQGQVQNFEDRGAAD